jgi:hypothetical protein
MHRDHATVSTHGCAQSDWLGEQYDADGLDPPREASEHCVEVPQQVVEDRLSPHHIEAFGLELGKLDRRSYKFHPVGHAIDAAALESGIDRPL